MEGDGLWRLRQKETIRVLVCSRTRNSSQRRVRGSVTQFRMRMRSSSLPAGGLHTCFSLKELETKV